MNIKETLLEDNVYSKATIMEVATYACSSEKRFRELMLCFLANNYRLAQRAAWCVGWTAKIKPAMIVPHVKALVEQLERNDKHVAVIRNSVRVLESIDIPEVYHGDVMNACFKFIESPSVPAAIKAFSLTTLYNLSKIYPEIKAELKLIIEDRMPHETAAFKSRGKKILKMISKT
ncbi:hypothetical protein BH10BAC2_BH10BAC2_26110 [soil metagenome]